MRRTSVMAILLAAGLLATAGPARAQGAKRVTVWIKCSTQGVIDTDWRIQFDVYDADGNRLGSTLTVTLPTGTNSAAAADRMAIATSLRTGDPAAAWREEVQTSGSGGKKVTANTAEDVVVSCNYTLRNIQTYKKKKNRWKRSHGHLQVVTRVTG